MYISKISSHNYRFVSFGSDIQAKISDNTLINEPKSKKLTPKKVAQVSLAIAAAILLTPLVFMLFKGKLKSKNFGKAYIEEIKSFLDSF